MRKISLFISIIIVLLSFYYAFADISFEELETAFLSIHYIYIIPAIFIVCLSFTLRAIRWRYLIKPIKKVKTSHLFSPLVVGFMGNLLPARAGEFIRAYLLSKKEDIKFSTSFATIVIERLFDLTMVLLLLFWVIFFHSATLLRGSSGEHLMSYILTFGWISLALTLLILIFSAFLQYKNDSAMKVVDICTRPLPRKWSEKTRSIVASFTEGLNIIKDKTGFIASISLSLIITIVVVLANYPLYLAFGLENNIPLLSSLTILCLTISIFVALFPTPGFLGAYQAAYVICLHEIFGVSKAVAASIGIIGWICSFGTIIIVGSFFIIKENISIVKLATEEHAE